MLAAEVVEEVGQKVVVKSTGEQLGGAVVKTEMTSPDAKAQKLAAPPANLPLNH